MDSEREQFENAYPIPERIRKHWASEQDAATAKDMFYEKLSREREGFEKGYAAGRLAQREQDAKIVEAESDRWKSEADKHNGFLLGGVLRGKADLLKVTARAIREAGEAKGGDAKCSTIPDVNA